MVGQPRAHGPSCKLDKHSDTQGTNRRTTNPLCRIAELQIPLSLPLARTNPQRRAITPNAFLSVLQSWKPAPTSRSITPRNSRPPSLKGDNEENAGRSTRREGGKVKRLYFVVAHTRTPPIGVRKETEHVVAELRDGTGSTLKLVPLPEKSTASVVLSPCCHCSIYSRQPFPPSFPSPGPDVLALRVPDVVKQRAAWLEHPREVLVKSGAVHVRRLAEGAGRRIVDNGGEFAVLESFHKLHAVAVTVILASTEGCYKETIIAAGPGKDINRQLRDVDSQLSNGGLRRPS